MDDEPMWAADRVVALTPGFAITIPETANEFAIKGNAQKLPWSQSVQRQHHKNLLPRSSATGVDAMTMKMDAQYKEFQSRSKPNPDHNDDDIPMSLLLIVLRSYAYQESFSLHPRPPLNGF
ncbi:hypothetical protein Tco_1213194 [Tanacetum coccineum]